MTAWLSGESKWRLLGVLVACLTVAVWYGSGRRTKPEEKSVVARQLVLAIDLSGSRSDHQLKADRQLVDAIIEGLEPGDQIVIIEVDGEARQRAPGRVSALPGVKDPRHLSKQDERAIADAREDMRGGAELLFRHRADGRPGRTNIVATLSSVADYVREAGGRKASLVMLSDMIQDAQGLKFDRKGGIPSGPWIDAQRERDLIPDLGRVCITVVGADPSTSQGVDFRNFWTKYFDAAGAQFSTARYRLTMSECQSLLCAD